MNAMKSKQRQADHGEKKVTYYFSDLSFQSYICCLNYYSLLNIEMHILNTDISIAGILSTI